MRATSLFATALFAAAVFLPSAGWAADQAPEFDGWYVSLTSGKLAEVKAEAAYTVRLIKPPVNVTQMMGTKDSYYAVDVSKAVSVKAADLKGVVAKGSPENFKAFSVHPVTALVPKEAGYSLFENKGPAQDATKIYVPGAPIETQSKKLGDDSYYWQPKEALKAGPYVVWVNRSFYFITVTE